MVYLCIDNWLLFVFIDYYNNMVTTAVVTENASLPDVELKDHLV